MRGRTLNDAFIILDEAQNTTSEQMKMFLTRIGFGSKAVVTGDVTQIDLPQGKTSGLREAQQLLSRIEGIKFVLFDERDVVRHPLVQSIITAYDALDREREAGRRRQPAASGEPRRPARRLTALDGFAHFGSTRPAGANDRPAAASSAERRETPRSGACGRSGPRAYVLVSTLLVRADALVPRRARPRPARSRPATSWRRAT